MRNIFKNEYVVYCADIKVKVMYLMGIFSVFCIQISKNLIKRVSFANLSHDFSAYKSACKEKSMHYMYIIYLI